MAIVTTYQGQTANTANSTVYTFASQAIGTAASDRIVVVTTESRGLGTGVTISAVTIGGISATVYQRENASSNSNISAIAFAVVPTGTTADIVITFSTERLRANIGVYSLAGASTTVTDNDSAQSTATSHTLLIDVAAGGAVFATSNNASSYVTSWSGVTEKYDLEVEAAMRFYATGAYIDAAAASTVSVVATPTASAILCTVALSLAPSSASGSTFTQLERNIRGLNRGVSSGF